MGREVTGGGNVVPGPATMGVSISAASLFRTAQDFCAGVDMVSPTIAAAPFGLLAAQCLELALKSYLMKKAGVTEQTLRNKIGHNIAKAWSQCVRAGLGLKPDMPTWAARLAVTISTSIP